MNASVADLREFERLIVNGSPEPCRLHPPLTGPPFLEEYPPVCNERHMPTVAVATAGQFSLETDALRELFGRAPGKIAL